MRRFIEDFKKAIKCLTIDTDGKLTKKKDQMSAQILTCIHNSISHEGALKVTTAGDSFKI